MIIKTIKTMITGLPFAFGILMYEAWVTMILWDWFMIPLFDLPALTFWASCGLVLFIGHMVLPNTTYGNLVELNNDEIKRFLLNIIAGPAIALLFGWTIHIFM